MRDKVRGVAALVFIGLLLYFSFSRQRTVAFELKPFSVHLHFSDEVKRRISETKAALGVQAILSDQEVSAHPLDAAILDHREQVMKPGDDTVRFEGKRLEFESRKGAAPLAPSLTIQVVSRLKGPAGNCIRCEKPVLKASALKEGENRIDLNCDGWLAMGVCLEAFTSP